MRFAQKVFPRDSSDPTGRHGDHASDNDFLYVLIGDPCMTGVVPWQLQTIDRPNIAVVELLFDMYVARAHWSIMLFHAPSMRERLKVLWRKPVWQRSEAGEVLVVLTIVVMGAILASENMAWPGHRVLDEHHIKLSDFRERLLGEINRHLLDVLADCSVESVQVCMILARYYAYVGKADLAWTVVGMACRNAYAAGFHLNPPNNDDPLKNEIRRRVWMATKTTDTFSAMFHSRPPSLDSNFIDRREPYHTDDLVLHPDLAAHPMLKKYGPDVDLLTYHNLKYELYAIMGKTLSAFRQIRANLDSLQNQRLLFSTVRETDALLNAWRERVPRFFDQSTWESNDPLGVADRPDVPWAGDARILTLQSLSLQVTFDMTIILLHRPVIELGLRNLTQLQDQQQQQRPEHHQPDDTSTTTSSTSPSPSRLVTPDDVSWAVHAAVAAALRTSRISISPMESESSLSMILLNYLTVCVVLCIPPIYEPRSVRAHEAKEGIYRVAANIKQLRNRSPLAEQTHTLLASLVARVVQRECAAAAEEDHALGGGSSGAANYHVAPAGPDEWPDANLAAAAASYLPADLHAHETHDLSVRVGNGWNAAAHPTELADDMISPTEVDTPEPRTAGSGGDASWTMLDLFNLIPTDSNPRFP